jgi:hypothetical protein
MTRLTHTATLIVAALPIASCIARSVTVESTPPGAEVRLNGRAVGTTPVTVPFRHYGVYRVELTKSGFETLDAEEPLLTPWWARFPLCIFTELLWPARIRDDRWLGYELEKPRTPERAGLLERADLEGIGGAARLTPSTP